MKHVLSATLLVCSFAITFTEHSSAAPVSWVGSTDNVWNTDSNWLTGVEPGSGDIAIFDSNSVANLGTVLGKPFTVLGVQITAPAGPVSIGGLNSLTLGSSGLNLSTATQNLTVTAPVALSADQTWSVNSGRVLTVNGGLTRTQALTISTAGLGQIQLSGTMSVDRLLVGNGVAAGEVVFSGGAWTQAGNLQTLGLAVGNGGSGTATFSTGTHTFGGDGYTSAVRVGTSISGQAATGVVNISGGIVRVGTAGATDAAINLGVAIDGSAGANGTLNVSGGTLEVGKRILIGANNNDAIGTLNLSGTGTINLTRTGVSDGNNGDNNDVGTLRPGQGLVTINLDGGTLITSGINTLNSVFERTTVSYNGTTIRANVNTGGFMSNSDRVRHLVKEGGFIFDTNGFNVTFNDALVDASGAQGSITKIGAGILTLTRENSTTGQVAVNSGTLSFAANGTVGQGAPILVASGATLRFDRDNTFGSNTANVSQAITVNGGTVTNGASFFTTLGAVTLNAGTINSTGGASSTLPSFSLKGPITVGGATASTISGSGTNSQMLVGQNSAGSQTTFNVADATNSTAADLNVSVILQNGRDNSLAEIATGIIKDGAGSMVLSATNTFTGATTINSGSLDVAGGSGSLAGTTAVVVNTGGTLLLSGSANKVNDGAAFTLNGGTINTGAVPGGNEQVGTLTLTSSSIIDFANLGSGVNQFRFADSSSTQSWMGTLSIYNWTGNPEIGGGIDQLYFGNGTTTGLTSAQLDQISFFSGAGTGFLGTGTFAFNGEVVAEVPEPSTWIAGLILLALIGCREGRKIQHRRRAARAA